jgi:plasmid stability protein
VAQLIVRNVEAETVQALKLRAARHGRSTEAEHRAILRDAVAARPRRRGLKDFIRSMPAVGEDADFERPRDLGRRTRL